MCLTQDNEEAFNIVRDHAMSNLWLGFLAGLSKQHSAHAEGYFKYKLLRPQRIYIPGEIELLFVGKRRRQSR